MLVRSDLVVMLLLGRKEGEGAGGGRPRGRGAGRAVPPLRVLPLGPLPPVPRHGLLRHAALPRQPGALLQAPRRLLLQVSPTPDTHRHDSIYIIHSEDA